MASGFRISIDNRMLRRDVDKAKARFNAVAVTLRDPGESEVIVSKRPKLPEERANKRQGRAGRKAVHGRLIAYELQRKGRDAFAYPPALRAQALEFLGRNFDRAINHAYRTNKSQKKAVGRVMLATAMILAYGAYQNVKRGGLGRNAAGYAKRKPAIANAINRPYVPWYGVLSGRFIGDYPAAPGFRARHRSRRNNNPNTVRPKRMPRDVFTR